VGAKEEISYLSDGCFVTVPPAPKVRRDNPSEVESAHNGGIGERCIAIQYISRDGYDRASTQLPGTTGYFVYADNLFDISVTVEATIGVSLSKIVEIGNMKKSLKNLEVVFSPTRPSNSRAKISCSPLSRVSLPVPSRGGDIARVSVGRNERTIPQPE